MKDYLIIDGYNIINNWEDLKKEMESMKRRMNSDFVEKVKAKNNSLEHLLDEKTRAILEKWRKEGL